MMKSDEITRLKKKCERLKAMLKCCNKERKEIVKERKLYQKIIDQLEKVPENTYTGKEIIVNGKQFNSIYSAAKFIVNSEKELGNIRKIDTIRKEIRKLYKRDRAAWSMYGRYYIELPS